MRRFRTRHLIGLPILLCAVFTAGAALRPRGNETPPYRDPKLPVEERVRDLLGRMTLVTSGRGTHSTLWVDYVSPGKTWTPIFLQIFSWHFP